MTEALVAPCGMNCGLCMAYQFRSMDLNKKGSINHIARAAFPGGKTAPIWLTAAHFWLRAKSGFAAAAAITPANG